MRSALFLLCCTLPSAFAAQAAQSNGIHCTIQPAAPLTDADRAFIAGQWANAESLYAARLSGTAALEGYAGVVRAQLAQNKLADALKTAQRAVAETPSSAASQALIGDVLLRSGKITEAGDAYNKAVSLDPCWARGQFGLGRLSDLTSHHATAARKMATAHTLAPGDAEITAAFLTTVPDAQRAAALRALLASHPVLAPDAVERLSDALAILDQHKTCTVTQPFASAKLELTPLMFDGVYERSWGLKVRLNDADTPLLELDSSVSGIVLNPRDAQRAGIHPLSSAPAPPATAYTAVADRVQIGTLEYHNCPVRVVPENALASSNSLIGTDFFRDHLIHIDYVAKLLALDPFPARPDSTPGGVSAPTDPYVAPEEKDWSPVYVAGSNILVPTMINKKGPFSFLLDTGTNRTVLAPDVADRVVGSKRDLTLNLTGTSGAIVKVVPRDGGPETDRTNVRGADGTLIPVTTPAKVPMYRFTVNEFTDPAAISFDLSPKSSNTGVEVSGLLGFYVLKNYFLDINYRDGLVQIRYDQNQRYKAREHQKDYHSLEY